jgi:hypothetical protein
VPLRPLDEAEDSGNQCSPMGELRHSHEGVEHEGERQQWNDSMDRWEDLESAICMYSTSIN